MLDWRRARHALTYVFDPVTQAHQRLLTMTLPGWICIGEVATLCDRLVTTVAPLAQLAVRDRGTWTLAVPGGSVVDMLLPAMAAAPLPWGSAHVFWCDERAVASDAPQSNWRAFQRVMDTQHQLRQATLHRMPADAPEPLTAAAAYAKELEGVAGWPPVLDLVLLGAGEDGHVASLFPHRNASHEHSRVVVVEEHSPKPPARRMSLALPVLAGARLTCVAAFGEGKRDAMRQVIDPASDLPVAQVLRMAKQPLLLLDAGAASALAASKSR